MMFTIPLLVIALALLGLGVALAIPCFVRTCGDPIARINQDAAKLKLYWVGLAVGLILVASGLAVSVSAANAMGTYKPAAKSPPPVELVADEPAKETYSSG